jgi:DNA-binding response OmpR family regulator
VPIIFTTTAEEIKEILAAFEAGAVDYVTKPTLPQEVELRVRLQLRLREHRAELKRENDALRREVESRLEAEEQPAGVLDQALVVANSKAEVVFATRAARVLLRAFFGDSRPERLQCMRG